jgi:hypothetical protein
MPRGWPALSPAPVSGFDVLDRLLDHFADRTRYPDLRTVVLVGHSAGAQLVHDTQPSATVSKR